MTNFMVGNFARLNAPIRKNKIKFRSVTSVWPIAARVKAGARRLLAGLREARRQQAVLVLERYAHLNEQFDTRRR
jgi:hypothetical protein